MKNVEAILLIRQEILKSSNLAFKTILKLPELKGYYLGLKYITTSNNAICKALNVPIEVGTCCKVELESDYNLVAPPAEFKYDYIGENVQFLSTNLAERERFNKSDSNQLNLLENGN